MRLAALRAALRRPGGPAARRQGGKAGKRPGGLTPAAACYTLVLVAPDGPVPREATSMIHLVAPAARELLREAIDRETNLPALSRRDRDRMNGQAARADVPVSQEAIDRKRRCAIGTARFWNREA